MYLATRLWMSFDIYSLHIVKFWDLTLLQSQLSWIYKFAGMYTNLPLFSFISQSQSGNTEDLPDHYKRPNLIGNGVRSISMVFSSAFFIQLVKNIMNWTKSILFLTCYGLNLLILNPVMLPLNVSLQFLEF